MPDSSRQSIDDGQDHFGRAVVQAVKGQIISAAWSVRHILFKLLVCLCLLLLVLVTMIVSLPAVVSNGIFGLDGTPPVPGATLESAYMEMSSVVSEAVENGYDQVMARVEQLIGDGGYDRELSMEALVNYTQGTAGYDVSYILAAYSASMEQQNAGKEDMEAKLESVTDRMFPLTCVEKEKETVVFIDSGMEENITEPEPDLTEESMAGSESDTVVEAAVNLITAEEDLEPAKQEALTPTTIVVKYLECTIQPFDNTVIAEAFGLDLNAPYNQFQITYGQAIDNMANALKMILYGTTSDLSTPLIDAELAAFVNVQNCNAARKALLTTGLSLVGRVPYFWGGKSAPGWNAEWNTPKQVTADGSPTTGTLRPYGLDCSGFTAWVYRTALGANIGSGTSGQYASTVPVSMEELLPGDLGFLADPAGGYNHVLIFAGFGENGERRWLHSTGGEGVVLNTPGYEGSLELRRPFYVDFDVSEGQDLAGALVSVIEVEVTHYCACRICCGNNADGITASGKHVEPGMVAMSSYYPFGTQIVINGRLYTVEDRGGSGIENDIYRVDVYVTDHEQARRMGRYRTTATVYRVAP